MEINNKLDKGGKILLYAFVSSFLVVLIATGYIFLFKKDYSFYVEAACDPTIETCFHRDCSQVDVCPPNNLETYKAYMVKADDFSQCSDNSCIAECSRGLIRCNKVECNTLVGDQCIGG